jgi:hypothetical protein
MCCSIHLLNCPQLGPWHTKVVSQVAHVESTMLLFLNLEFECLVFWQCKIVHFKVRGKWNTLNLQVFEL